MKNLRDIVRRFAFLMPLIFPLYFWRVEISGVPFTVVELAVYLLALGWLVTGGLNKKFVHKVAKDKVFWMIGVFLLAAVVSTAIVPEVVTNVDGGEFEALKAALGVLKGWVFMPILYMLIAYSFIKTDKEKKFLLLALMWSGVWLSLWALYQVLTGDYVTIDGRASAFYESANYLALYLGPICVIWGIGFLEAFRTRSFWREIYFLVPGLLTLVAMFFAASYAGWIAVFAGIFFYAMLSKKYTKKSKIAAMVALFVMFSLFVASQLGSAKLEGFLEFEDRSSTSARLQIWNASVEMIEDHPLLGVGLGQFEVNYQLKMKEIYDADTYEWLMPHPHNFILGIWLNFGLLGVVAIIGVIILAFAKVRMKDDMKLIFAAMLFAVIMHGLFDMPFMKNDLAMQFWLLIALLL